MERKEFDSLVDLPAEAELSLYLIKEELKSWKFFNALREMELDDNFYQTDLSELILSSTGHREISDDVCDFYRGVMEKHSSQMKATLKDTMRHALLVYAELVSYKRNG